MCNVKCVFARNGIHVQTPRKLSRNIFVAFTAEGRTARQPYSTFRMNTDRVQLLFLEYTYQESKKGRAYLKACHHDAQLVSQNSGFWADMVDDSKLSEERCLPKSPRIGQKYQCNVDVVAEYHAKD